MTSISPWTPASSSASVVDEDMAQRPGDEGPELGAVRDRQGPHLLGFRPARSEQPSGLGARGLLLDDLFRSGAEQEGLAELNRALGAACGVFAYAHRRPPPRC
jgi:hypothetical protein